MAYLLFLLPFLLLFAVPVTVRFEAEDAAVRYARDYLTSYYYANRKFPDSFSVPGYPFTLYSHGGNSTNSTWATVKFAGKDREFGTSDDRVITLTGSMLEKNSFSENLRRARILEQAAYNICQRRFANGTLPIWPGDLDEVVKEANLPADYKNVPFGNDTYVYDTSSCRTDDCWCSTAIVYLKHSGPACPSGYTYNPLTVRCEASPVCPTGSTYNTVTNKCETAVSTVYACSVDGNTYADLTACQSSCRIQGTCSKFWFWYRCDIDHHLYHDQQSCEDNCYQPGTCSEQTICPTGFTLSGSVCQTDPTCPDGGTLDTVNDVCFL